MANDALAPWGVQGIKDRPGPSGRAILGEKFVAKPDRNPVIAGLDGARRLLGRQPLAIEQRTEQQRKSPQETDADSVTGHEEESSPDTKAAYLKHTRRPGAAEHRSPPRPQRHTGSGPVATATLFPCHSLMREPRAGPEDQNERD
jgi:hypothetical protein